MVAILANKYFMHNSTFTIYGNKKCTIFYRLSVDEEDDLLYGGTTSNSSLKK